MSTSTLDASHLLLLIAGAAALLLWGTRMARTGVTRAYGSEIRRVISSGLSNRMVAAFSGLASAAILQSSMAVALFLASFSRLGAVNVETGLAVMLGADVGSAVVASLLSLNVKQYWPVLIAAGYIVHAIYDGSNGKGKQLGRVLLGLGLVLLALNALSAAARELSSSELLQQIFASLQGQSLLIVVVAALLTWLAHSSIAILLLVASMAAAGVITSPETIVALVLGVNAGGGIPAVLLTWSETSSARRITLGNLIFRFIAAISGLLLISQLAKLYLALTGYGAFGVVALHLIINLSLGLVLIWVITPFARMLEWCLPTVKESGSEFGPKFLDKNLSHATPSLAISALTGEILRMIELVEGMLGKCRDLLSTHDARLARDLHTLDDRLDILYEAVKNTATELSRGDIEVDEGRRAVDIISYAANLENAGDLIEKNLLDTLEKKIKANAMFSSVGQQEIQMLFDYVRETGRIAANIAISWKRSDAEILLQRKSELKQLAQKSLDQHLLRLRNREKNTVESSSFHIDLLSDLQRINSLICGVGYSVARA